MALAHVPVLQFFKRAAAAASLLAVQHNCSRVLQSRNFIGIFISIANRPDRDRIKEIGPNRACAEWLLRCGASVKWKGSNHFQTDYNLLSSSDYRSHVIEEVEADEATIMGIGFDHFDGCENIRRVQLHRCTYINDDAVQLLINKLKSSLEHLEIVSCGDVSDGGLASITQLSHLKSLILENLPEVRNKKACYDLLKRSLPDCSIDYRDMTQSS